MRAQNAKPLCAEELTAILCRELTELWHDATLKVDTFCFNDRKQLVKFRILMGLVPSKRIIGIGRIGLFKRELHWCDVHIENVKNAFIDFEQGDVEMSINEVIGDVGKMGIEASNGRVGMEGVALKISTSYAPSAYEARYFSFLVGELNWNRRG